VVTELPADWHVVAPDLRGHGRSYRPDSLTDWNATADVLLPLLDAHCGTTALLVGHSMGGYAAARLAAQRQGVCGAMLLDPVILPPDFYPADMPTEPLDPDTHPVARRRNHWTDAEEMRVRFADRTPYSLWQPNVLADYCQWGVVPAPGGSGYELACPPALEASAYLGSLRRNPFDFLSAITCPVTLVRGRTGERQQGLDFSISPTWPGLAVSFANGRDLVWSDCSHFIPMEAPERLAALICAEMNGIIQG
jgi:lipase